jgi:hypothetical protein
MSDVPPIDTSGGNFSDCQVGGSRKFKDRESNSSDASPSQAAKVTRVSNTPDDPAMRSGSK